MSERKNNSIMNSTVARKRLLVVSAASLLCTSLSCSLTQAQEPLRETLREETARQSDLSRIFQEPAEPLTMAAAIRLAL